MRERLTAAFVVLAVGLVVAVGLVAGYAREGVAREEASRQVATEAALLAALVDERLGSGAPVDTELLAGVVAQDDRIEVVIDGQQPVVVEGAQVDAGDDTISSMLPVSGGYVVVEHPAPTPFDLLGESPATPLLLLAGVGLVAGLAGYAIARSLSGPFRQLANAAAALGRGRFDLDLPSSGNPEAQAIARALGNSAGQLRDRLEREQRFALHASHVLRTPLTSLRLSLDELVSSDDVSPDARVAARRGLQAVEELDAAAGELVELSRTSTIVAGAEIPLRDLATLAAQRWATALAARGRRVSAAVEGEHDLPVTPGPVETVLDLLLEEVVAGDDGDVRLVLVGGVSSLRIQVTGAGSPGPSAADASPGPQDPQHSRDSRDSQDSEGADASALRRTRMIVEGLGGWVEERGDGDRTLTVLLPRR